MSVEKNPSENSNDALARHENGSAIDFNDPSTRVLIEQLLATLTHDGSAPEARRPNRGLTDILAMARRRWKPALAVFLISFALVAYKMRPRGENFTATATIILPQPARAGSDTTSQQQSSVLASLGIPGAFGGPNADTQIAILTSTPLVRSAMEKLPPDLRQRGWGSSDLGTAAASVQVSGLSTVPDIVNVTAMAADPKAATEMANSLIDVYTDWTKHKGEQKNKESLQLVQQQKRDAEQQLLKAKQDLRAYKEQNSIFDLGTAQTAVTAKIQDLLDKSQAARTEAAAGATSSVVMGDSIVNDLQSKANEAKTRYERILRDFYPDAPEARAAAQSYHQAQSLVDQRLGVLTRAAQDRARDAEKAYQDAMREAAVLPKIEYRLTMLANQVGLLENTYKALADRETALRLMSYAEANTATTLSPAAHAHSAGRTWSRSLLIALLCALALAALLTIALEQMDRSIHTSEELETTLHTTVLANLPYMKPGSERRLALVSPAQVNAAHLLESCRILRSNLAFSTTDSPLRSVLITSADPGEGKSLCALNLATVMALDGKRVILLDCDLRRPTQHFLSQAPLEPGFTNVLDNEATLDEALQATAVNNLWLLPAGSLPSNPPALLGSEHSQNLIQELQERCDIVVIDSPPVLSLADAQVLSTLADGVVLVVAADSTPREHVQRTKAMLRHAGSRLIGMVLNKVQDFNNPDAHAGYSYYYTAAQAAENGAGKSLMKWK